MLTKPWFADLKLCSKGADWPIRICQDLTLGQHSGSILSVATKFFPYNKLLVYKTKISLIFRLCWLKFKKKDITGFPKHIQQNSGNRPHFRKPDLAHFTASKSSQGCTNAKVARRGGAAASGRAGRRREAFKLVYLPLSKPLPLQDCVCPEWVALKCWMG